GGLRIRVNDVERFEGALSRYGERSTIARSENRAIWRRGKDTFTDPAIARASDFGCVAGP
ncbi:562_t:CDS:1, partial [Paraglomus occultum]